jgi:hypothetical protein
MRDALAGTLYFPINFHSSCIHFAFLISIVRSVYSIQNPQIPGSRIVFGGNRLTNHSIPECYGAWEPTAVFVPLEEMLKSKETFELATTEIFGPFQVRISAVLSLFCFLIEILPS